MRQLLEIEMPYSIGLRFSMNIRYPAPWCLDYGSGLVYSRFWPAGNFQLFSILFPAVICFFGLHVAGLAAIWAAIWASMFHCTVLFTFAVAVGKLSLVILVMKMQ